MAKQLTEQNTNAVMSDVPAYLMNKNMGIGRGAENVTTDDLVIPRIELVQDLSPCRRKSDPNYIEGCEEGMLYNNLTRELYGTSCLVVPVYYRKEFLVWKDRDSGGGFRGAYQSQAMAQEAINDMEDADLLGIAETAQHFVVLVHPETGRTEEAVISMSRSKLKISRKWNSLIRMNGGDSFSRVYRISAVGEKNNKNQDFFNLSVVTAGFPSEEVYNKCEKLYDAIVSGAVDVDRKFDDTTDSSDSSEF